MEWIDISNCNGNIDFNRVKAAGINGVIIKATEGANYFDDKCQQFYEGARAAGIEYITFYHFFRELNNIPEQVRDFCSVVKDKYHNVKLALDVEVNTKGRSAQEMMNRCQQFMDGVKNTIGEDMMIYSYTSFLNSYLTDPSWCNNQYLWQAEYNNTKHTKLDRFGDCNILQYTDKGIVDGVSGYVDRNIVMSLDGILLDGSSTHIPSNNPPSPSGQLGTPGKIAELQRLCHITDDGIWGPQTDAAVRNLPLAGLPYHTPELTKWVQRRLFSNPKDIDGIFGQGTCNEVKKWQSAHGLVVDGIVGYNTIKSLALA